MRDRPKSTAKLLGVAPKDYEPDLKALCAESDPKNFRNLEVDRQAILGKIASLKERKTRRGKKKATNDAESSI